MINLLFFSNAAIDLYTICPGISTNHQQISKHRNNKTCDITLDITLHFYLQAHIPSTISQTPSTIEQHSKAKYKQQVIITLSRRANKTLSNTGKKIIHICKLQVKQVLIYGDNELNTFKSSLIY